MENEKREKFGSRLGFILVSAGCAVGLGNVWKFPYICGMNGGAAFILVYLGFLLLLGLPILISEFAIGRGSGKSVGSALELQSQCPDTSAATVYTACGKEEGVDLGVLSEQPGRLLIALKLIVMDLYDLSDVDRIAVGLQRLDKAHDALCVTENVGGSGDDSHMDLSVGHQM